ncbi:MAG: sugar phosphate isomerase/epimerase [Herpetosiphonaceae bacterium]|nr:sugar phosphate isomerase/epimerase [Herpetosiphonaceae bacterium]
MQFAVFTVGLPEFTPQQAVAALHQLGYDGIEWRVTAQQPAVDDQPSFWTGNRCTWPFHSFVADASEIRSLTEQASLQMPSVGTYVTCDDIEAVERAMQGVVQLGAPRLRINVPRYDGTTAYRPLYERAVGQYHEVAALAQQYHVQALIEMHHGSLTPSASAAAHFLSNFDPRYVGAIHDAGNMVYEGYEQYRLGLEMLGPYLAHVHLKNARWQSTGTRPDGSTIWDAQWAPITQGIVDMGALFRALHSVGYDGWVSFEDFSTEQPLLERLRDNLAYVKRVAQQAREE